MRVVDGRSLMVDGGEVGSRTINDQPTTISPLLFARAGEKPRAERAWFRADGRTLCSVCGKPYSAHPADARCTWLTRLCDGQRVKL